MSQHDYVIDNGPGAAVRGDINAALLAVVSLNSGPLAPTTTYAGQLWLDTSVGVQGTLKMRNLANTGWTFPNIYGDDRVGEVSFYARSTPPVGWLKANGQAVSRTDYSALFTAIGTQFGVGDGSTTFNVPDTRGRFIRSWDDGKGLDPSRAFGSTQADSVKNHSHTGDITINAGGSHTHTGDANSGGAHTHTVSGTAAANGAHSHGSGLRTNSAGASGAYVVYGVMAAPGAAESGMEGGASASALQATTSTSSTHTHTVSGTAASNGAHTHTLTIDAAPAHSHTATMTIDTGGGGTETRGLNIALLGCIRYA